MFRSRTMTVPGTLSGISRFLLMEEAFDVDIVYAETINLDPVIRLMSGILVEGVGMDRLNHIKIVTPDPEAIDRFLREVVDLPEGWPLGVLPSASAAVTSPDRNEQGSFTFDSVMAFRGGSGQGGFITGSSESRQFQIVHGDKAHIWAVAIGTRHLERAHERCRERDIPCTEPTVSGWGEGDIRFFFAEVGGIIFEVMRIEPART
jgi:hypothetical protein